MEVVWRLPVAGLIILVISATPLIECLPVGLQTFQAGRVRRLSSQVGGSRGLPRGTSIDRLNGVTDFHHARELQYTREVDEVEGIVLPGGKWVPNYEPRGCTDLSKCRLPDEQCEVSDDICYEFLRRNCGGEAASRASSDCPIDYVKVLQAYDQRIFEEVQAIVWALFSLPPELQQSLVQNVTGSVNAGAPYVRGTLSLFDSFLRLLPLVEDDLQVKFNETGWRSILDDFQKNETSLIGADYFLTPSSGSAAPGNNRFLARLAAVFVLRDGSTFGEFLSTIQWKQGLLENFGLTEKSFKTIVDSFEKQSDLEKFLDDLGLLVENIRSVRALVVL